MPQPVVPLPALLGCAGEPDGAGHAVRLFTISFPANFIAVRHSKRNGAVAHRVWWWPDCVPVYYAQLAEAASVI